MNGDDNPNLGLHLPPPGTYNPDTQPVPLKLGRPSRQDSREMMLNLAILETVRPVGKPLTQRAIADVCGCSNALIYLITKEALAKMQKAARRMQLLEEQP